MSVEADIDQAQPDHWQRLPQRLRPRTQEQLGKGTQRRIETAMLLLILAVFALAVGNDLVRQIHINSRLSADLHSWREITGHNYHNLSLQQDLKHYTTREVVCGNTSPGAPGIKPQICLIFTGPVVHSLRRLQGGFYLPPYVQDVREDRYACFGSAAREHLCGLATPAGAPHEPLPKGS